MRRSVLPDRVRLRPGTRVARRGDGWLQVGLHPERSVVAGDSPEVRGLLGALTLGTELGPLTDLPVPLARVCRALLERELLVDATALAADLAGHASPADRGRVGATYAEHGLATAAVLARRAGSPVLVRHHRRTEGGPRIEDLLHDAGVPTEGTPRAALLVSRGEPARDLPDAWLHDDLPHLVVTATADGVRIGPFVEPGRTACLRCLDAHRADHDPRWPLVLLQHVTAADAAPDVPDPVPGDLLALALVWAVRDLVGWLDGRRPRSWSTTIDVGPDLALPVRAWPQHPACGCAWEQRFAG